MTPDIDVQLKNLQSKLQQVLKQYQLLQKENEHLKKQLEQSKKHVVSNNVLHENTQQNSVVNGVVQQQMNVEDNAALQKKIDKYLQEIDKCIVLLNATA